MPTGDGLLVRLLPIGTIPLAAFAALCAAARAHGNGIIEITSRGNIQVRGLSAASAPQFAAAVAALDIAAEDGVPVLCNPLAGLDAEEVFDAAALAAELRRALAQRSFAAKLVAKSLRRDRRRRRARSRRDRRRHSALRASDRRRSRACASASAATKQARPHLGYVAPAHGVEAALRLLDVIARRGRDARARDILAGEGVAVFRAAIADLLMPAQRRPRQRDERIAPIAIGTASAARRNVACGIGARLRSCRCGFAGTIDRRRAPQPAQAASAPRRAERCWRSG